MVSAHPLADSLCHRLARTTRIELDGLGWTVEALDLYASGFGPALTPEERRSYYRPEFDQSSVLAEVNQLRRAEILVLVFPTWWFGFPAIMKGWFDRVWAPGVAFTHAADLGTIRPQLAQLRWVFAVTTLGAPRWVDWFILRSPVRRVLKTALVRACAPQARFSMRTLYRAETADSERVGAFEESVRATIRRNASLRPIAP